MRLALMATVAAIGLIGLAAPSQAAPAAPHRAGFSGGAPEFLPVADGCGRGWHRERWRNRHGYWRSRCVPNRW